MEGEQQPVYEQYPQYKNVNGVNIIYINNFSYLFIKLIQNRYQSVLQ